MRPGACTPPPTALRYLFGEAGLILLWSYVVLVAGTVTGLINFRIQVASATLGVAILGGWLTSRALQRRGIPRAGIEWGWLALIATQLAAALLSHDVRRSLPVVAHWITYGLIFYCLLDSLRSGWPAELLEKTLLIVGGIAVGLALLDLLRAYLDWRNIVAGLPLAPRFEYRLYAVFGEANLLAAFVNLLMPLAAARALASRARLPRLLLGGWVIGAIAVQYFASSRGGLVGMFAAWATFSALSAGSLLGHFRRWMPGMRLGARLPRAMLLPGALLALLPLGWMAGRVLRVGGDATHSPLLQARSTFWKAAAQAFKESPGWGIGPGLYPSVLMRVDSMPPARPFLHAHSVPFTVAAESGLLGLLGLATAAFVLARAVLRSKPESDSGFEARARWAAIVASLVGFAVHSLVDDHTRYLATAVPMLALLAMALSSQRSEGQHPNAMAPDGKDAKSHSFLAPLRHRGFAFRGFFSPLWLFVPGLAAVGFTAYSLRAHAFSEGGIDAALAGDWRTAAQKFDAAAVRDPSFAFYWLQAGYAYGMLASRGDTPALAAAIDHTRQGIALDPNYALNHANLAALFWQAGQSEEARAEMRRAVDLAPLAAPFWLNLGAYDEALGAEETARSDFRSALDADVSLADSAFWSATALRRSALADWRAGRPADPAPTTARGFVERARSEIADGGLSAAERDLRSAWQLGSQNISIYLSLAELAVARGEMAQADRYIRSALWVQSQSNAEKVWPLIAWAELALQQGDTPQALARYRTAFDAVTEYTIYGWGSWGWNPYPWFVFQRRSLPGDVLPQMVRAGPPPEMTRRLEPLAYLYEAGGDAEAADQVRVRLAAVAP